MKKITEMTDYELAQLWGKATDKACLEFMQRYNNYIEKILQSMFSYQHDHEDAKQDLYMKLWVKGAIINFREDGHMKAYLKVICKNIWRERVGQKVKKEEKYNEYAYQMSCQYKPLSEEKNNPETAAIINEEKNMLHELVSKLSFQQREAIIGHSFWGLKYGEIACIMKKNVSNVGLIIFRAKANMLKNIKGKYHPDISVSMNGSRNSNIFCKAA